MSLQFLQCCCIEQLRGALRSMKQICQLEACLVCPNEKHKQGIPSSKPRSAIHRDRPPPPHAALTRKCVHCACRHSVCSVHAHTHARCILAIKGIQAVFPQRLQLASITCPHQTSSFTDMHVEFSLQREISPLEIYRVFIQQRGGVSGIKMPPLETICEREL